MWMLRWLRFCDGINISIDFFNVSGILIISIAHGAIVCRHYPAKGVELKYVVIYMLQRKAAWSYDCAAFLFLKKSKIPLDYLYK